MAILIGPNTKVICQGMTGRTASYHIERAMAYGTNVVGGVRPGKGGTQHLDAPIFDSVSDAVSATGADASIIFVPPPNAADAMIEAISAHHEIVPIGRERTHAPATNYRFADGSPGRIGVIASVTRPFCGACSRLRVTADGRIMPCLFSTTEWDIRTILRSGADDRTLARALVNITLRKQAGHRIGADDFQQPDSGFDQHPHDAERFAQDQSGDNAAQQR